MAFYNCTFRMAQLTHVHTCTHTRCALCWRKFWFERGQGLDAAASLSVFFYPAARTVRAAEGLLSGPSRGRRCTPASYAGRARRRACERRAAAAGWQVPAEPTMPRLNSQVLGF